VGGCHAQFWFWRSFITSQRSIWVKNWFL